MKYKSLITFCFIGFSVFAADDYGYSEHSGLNLKFYVEKCNSEMPGLIARFSKLTSDDLASFRVIYEGVSEENNAAKMAYRSGLKLTHMPPKKALDKCFTYISKHMDLQIEAMTRYDEMMEAKKAQEAVEAKRREEAEARRVPALAADPNVDKYAALITATVERYMILEPSMRGKTCTIGIKLASSGFVISVDNGQGDPAVCRSGKSAVLKANQLPVPKDPAAFDMLKEFKLKLEPNF